VTVADEAGDVFAVEQNAIFFVSGFEADGCFGGEGFQTLTFVQRQSRTQRLEGEGAVHGSGFKVEQTEVTGQMARDGAFPRARRPINGNDRLPAGFLGAQAAFFPGHPRFFVLCFGGAVKPYCLLFPALAPAVKAGLRLPRAERASVRTSLRVVLPRFDPIALPAGLPLPEWPLRWALAAADGFPLRALEMPLAGRAEWTLPFPLERAPLADAAPA
jgi:hypothetical protein